MTQPLRGRVTDGVLPAGYLRGVQWLSEASPEEVRSLVDRGEFFWLDLVRQTGEQVAKLVEAAGADPRAAERAFRFGEVPQLRRERGHTQLVFYGADATAAGPWQLVEVHAYVSEQWIVSVRKDPCRALEDLRTELNDSPPAAKEAVVGRVLGALVGSFEGMMDSDDEEIERLEEAAAEGNRPPVELRREILERRGRLVRDRRLARRQRDYVESAVAESGDIPGFDPRHRDALGDVAGQMIRVMDRVDDNLEGLATALDLLNSTVANRLNVIMERLTVVATIFLPLTLVTSFFGQNFGWMVDHITSLATFLVLGVGLFAASGLLIYMWLLKRIPRVGGG
jgi:magnesium transporter